MSVPFDINSAADLVDLSIQTITLKDIADVTEYHKEYYSVEMVQDQLVKDSSLSAVRSYGRRTEGQPSKVASPVQGFDKTYTQAKYDGMFSVTDQMWMFGIQTRQLEQLVNSQRKLAMQAKEQILCNVLNNSTSTSFTDTNGDTNFTHDNTGGDGVAPFSAAHTREDGGANWSNIVPSNPVFSYSAWKTALTTAQAIPGPVGEVLDVTPDTLVVKKNSTAHFKALEILGAIRRNEIPTSADNDGAGVAPFKVLALPYITDGLNWWAFDSKMMEVSTYGLQLKQAMPLTVMERDIDYANDQINYKLKEFYDYGFNDMRCWVYSSGAGV